MAATAPLLSQAQSPPARERKLSLACISGANAASGSERRPGWQRRHGSKAAGPGAVPCKPGIKHPHPDPIFLFPTKPILAHRQGLTLRGPRSSSSTAAGWCGVGSPTPAARGCRTAPSSRLAASWQWLLSSGHPPSVGETGTGSAEPPEGHVLPRCAGAGQHTEQGTRGSPTHPHGQGKYAAAAEPRRPQRALAAAGHRDVALLVITWGRAPYQHRGAGPTLARGGTRQSPGVGHPHSPRPHLPQMRISFLGPDVFPRQMLHLGSSPGTPAVGRGDRGATATSPCCWEGSHSTREGKGGWGNTHHAGCPSRGPSTWSYPRT